jgi:ATP diphosphatase
MNSLPASPDLADLLALVARLRAPDGCPWDRKQTLADLRSYLIEEAHEVAAAIDRDDLEELASELGDLLFQVAFVATLAEEAGGRELAESVRRVHTKMVERHPHVFGDASNDAAALADAEAVAAAWERRKVEMEPQRDSLLDGVADSLPELVAAYRLTQKAAGVGFDWPDARQVLDKLDEEAGELREALAALELARDGAGPPSDALRTALQAEVGDLLFTAVNLARKLDVDPGSALARTNLKFRRRFQHIERRLREQGRSVNDADLDEMEALWLEAKREV